MTSNGNTDYFDVAAVHSHLKNCLLDDGDIHLDSYLQVYKGLMTFCDLLGSVFRFVKIEIESKSEVLNRLKSEQSDEFKTIKGMVRYEKRRSLLNKQNYTSGSRTLLRLHWGFNFLRLFLREVHDLGSDEGTSSVGRDVYNSTLAQNHVWYVRLGAKAAMCTLPTRQVFMETVCGGKIQPAIVGEIPRMLEVADEVYERTQNIYRTENLLDLE